MRRFIRQRKQKVSTRALCVCTSFPELAIFLLFFFPPQCAVICNLIPQQDNMEKPSEGLEIPVCGLVSLPALNAEMITMIIAVHWVQNVWFWFLY